MELGEIKNKTQRGRGLPRCKRWKAGHSEVLTQCLRAMAKFHIYSFGNIMLIARQKPSASKVAGVRT